MRRTQARAYSGRRSIGSGVGEGARRKFGGSPARSPPPPSLALLLRRRSERSTQWRHVGVSSRRIWNMNLPKYLAGDDLLQSNREDIVAFLQPLLKKGLYRRDYSVPISRIYLKKTMGCTRGCTRGVLFIYLFIYYLCTKHT